MATITSDEGYFQITSIEFYPKVVAIGETAYFSITIKNVSGKSVSSCYVYMSGHYPSTNSSTGYGYYTDVYLHGGPAFAFKSISWGNNVSQTFNGAFTFGKGFYAVDESNYAFPISNSSAIHIGIVTNATFSNGTNYSNFTNICGASGENLRVLSKRDNPKLSLEMERTPNDESMTVKTSIKLNADVTSTVLSNHGYTFKLYRSSAHDPATTSDTVTTLNCTLAQMYTGITNSTSAVTTTFSNQSEWYFTLVLTNGYETAVANTSIPRAFANVHLSGCTTGGVAFGKFSGATEGHPIFECEYPVQLNGGIESVGNVINALLALGIQAGFVEAVGNTSGGSYKDIYVTFEHPYATGTLPIVIPCFFTQSTAGSFGRGNVSTYAVSNTGFTMRFYNGDSSNRNPSFFWLALGVPPNGQ